MAYEDFRNLTKRFAADKVLRDKAFNIAKNSKCDGYQRELASIVHNFFDKKSEGSAVVNNKQNIQLTEELHKPIIRNLKKRTVYSKSRDIFGVQI